MNKEQKIAKNIIETIGNTPLVKINHLNKNKKVEVLAKLESFNPGGSVKDRIVLKMLEQGEKEGTLTKEKTIIEATSGNTGIALAMLGAVKGYKVEIIMSDAVSVERQRMIKAFGAKITLTPGKEGTDGAIRKRDELVRKYPEKYFSTDQFTNKYNKISHYETTANEIWKQTAGKLTHFVAALGTSGTIMGVSKFLKEHNKDIKVVAVEPVKGHYIQGLKNMKEAIIPAIYDPTQFDEKIMIDNEDAFETSRQLAKQEGILAGMSSGAAMWAALQVAKDLKKGTIVVILPDTGERYLSTELFKV